MTTEVIDENYYINVKELMSRSLPRPKHRTTVLVASWNEWLPIVTVECET